MTPEKGTEFGLAVNKIEIPVSLSEMAYEAIKESLLKLDFSQLSDEGRLDERELAMRLGVSRTPLREAINRLVSEGFLQVVPRKGVYVVKKSKQEIIEILLVRAALEGMAARLATKYVTKKDIQRMKEIFSPFDPSNVKEKSLKYSDANVKFHELVIQLSQCAKLVELASNLFDHTRWIRIRAGAFAERHSTSLREHLQIIDALEKKNPDLAEKRIRKHIESLAQYVEEKVAFLP